MAGNKETARQRMIGLMYLVLLAMLALNVSDLVLKAFNNINHSLSTSKDNVNANITQLLSSYEQTKAKESPEKAAKLQRARKAQKIADDFIKYVDSIQTKIAADGFESDGQLKQKNNLDIGQHIMGNESQKGEGVILQQKINETGAKLAALLKIDEGKPTFSLQAKDPKNPQPGEPQTWVVNNFGEGVPLAAFRTILTMIQNDAKNMEADIINRILADKPIVTIDKFEAIAVAPNTYVIQGQPYKAEIYLTASDSRGTPDISVNGAKVQTDDGKGIYVGATGSVGTFKWKGTIRVKQTDGQIKTYQTPEQSYTVAKPSVSISSDKLNLIYAGIPNPFTISAPGFADISASITGGSMSGSNGKYMINIPASYIGKEVTINVTGKNGATNVNVGGQKFRVKAVPDPVSAFGGKKGGLMSAARISNVDQIDAIYENFEFDLKAKVTSFTLTVIKPRQEPSTFNCTGSGFSLSAKNALNNLPYGTRVVMENILAQLPDGRTRALGPLVFAIN